MRPGEGSGPEGSGGGPGLRPPPPPPPSPPPSQAYLILFETEQQRAADNLPFVDALVSGLEVRAICESERWVGQA